MKMIYVIISFMLIAYLFTAIGAQFFTNIPDDAYPIGDGSDIDVFSGEMSDFIIRLVLGIAGGIVISWITFGSISADKAVAYGFFTGAFYSIWGLGTSLFTDFGDQVNNSMGTSFPFNTILTVLGLFVFIIGIAAMAGGDMEGY